MIKQFFILFLIYFSWQFEWKSKQNTFRLVARVTADLGTMTL